MSIRTNIFKTISGSRIPISLLPENNSKVIPTTDKQTPLRRIFFFVFIIIPFKPPVFYLVNTKIHTQETKPHATKLKYATALFCFNIIRPFSSNKTPIIGSVMLLESLISITPTSPKVAIITTKTAPNIRDI